MPKSKRGAPRKPRANRKAAASKGAAKPKRKKTAKPADPALEAGPPAPHVPHPGGRLTIFTQELADLICERLAEGQSLRTVCRADDMPAMSSVFRWLRLDEKFSEQYARAKENAADAVFEEMMDIADDGTNDWMERLDKDQKPIGWMLNGEHVQRSKLRIDTRKWQLSKMKPKKYGDSIAVTGKDGAPLAPPVILPTMAPDEAARLYRELLKAG